jgi:hypothetical protein
MSSHDACMSSSTQRDICKRREMAWVHGKKISILVLTSVCSSPGEPCAGPCLLDSIVTVLFRTRVGYWCWSLILNGFTAVLRKWMRNLSRSPIFSTSRFQTAFSTACDTEKKEFKPVCERKECQWVQPRKIQDRQTDCQKLRTSIVFQTSENFGSGLEGWFSAR